MKKRLLIVFLMLVAGYVSQVSAQQEFRFIPKIGVNLANINGTGGTDLKAGLNAGFSVEWMLQPKFAIEPGVFYSMQGCKFPSGTKIKLDYINVPILAKYYLVKGFNVFAGPQVGFNTMAKTEYAVAEGEEDLKDYIKPIDLALATGVGYQFDMGLMVSAGFNWSFINHMKKSDLLDDNDNKYHNIAFQFNVGWRF